MAERKQLRGKVLLVTGAGSGFGKLVSEKAVRLGAQVAALDISVEGLPTAEEILPIQADVTEAAEMRQAVAQTVERFGRVDVLVNSAGIMPLAFFADHEQALDAWTRCLDVNIKGVLNGMVAVFDQMIAQERGHVVNLSSIYGNFPVVGAGVYGATKAAVNYLSESLRVESQGKIKVTVIKPTGVPGTGLNAGVINIQASVGIIGQNAAEAFATMQRFATGNLSPEEQDVDHPRYAILHPEAIADAILYAISQPWGVSLADLTVRATGEHFIL